MRILFFSFLFLLASSTQALAEQNLSVVISEKQKLEMSETFSELNENDVTIKFISPENIYSCINDNYIIIVATQKDKSFDFIKDKLSPSVLKNINNKGYGKYILLRDPWMEEQEVVLLIGDNDDTISLIREKTWANWWSTVANWFDINTMMVKPY